MWQKINVSFLIVISILINQTFSAVMWNLEKEDEIRNIRSDKREQDVHRGVLLSYSTEEKNMLCQDFYHAQLYNQGNQFVVPKKRKEIDVSEGASSNVDKRTILPVIDPRITDDPTNTGEPTHSLVITKPTIGGEALSDEVDIYFTCANKRKPSHNLHFLSYAFRSGWFYTSLLDKETENHPKLDRYMGKSPDYIPLEREEVEEKYMITRETIDRLAEESPRYAELIRKRDDLLDLSRWQHLMLCGSILASPIYKDGWESTRIKPSKKWIETTKDELVNFDKTISFVAKKYKLAKVKVDCILCRGIEDYSGLRTNLCITRSYEDKHSAYVLEYYDGPHYTYYMTKYFRNIHILKNARESITEGEIFLRYT